METGAVSALSAQAPSAAQASSNKLAKDFDTFLTLLTTQLQQQDPLDPLKSNEFTDQLVSFTSVEQEITANKNLEKLIGLQQGDKLTGMVGYLGKDVAVAATDARLENGQAQWNYSLGNAADSVKYVIRDAAGRIVRSGDGEIAPGDHTLEWNGIDDNGNTRGDGVYSLNIIAQTQAGTEVSGTVFVTGKVTSVEATGETPTLTVGGLPRPLSTVITVSEPASKNTSGL